MTYTMKLELIQIPVSDIDRAKTFYAEQLGFNVDHDVTPSEGVRIVQLTPHDSGCSILLGKGVGELDIMQAGSIKGIHLVVDDIEAVRSALVSKEADIAEVFDMGGVKYAPFSDPDGNTWTLQEIP
ncbi:MAG: VOC family protein [Chloroflexota bacterium]